MTRYISKIRKRPLKWIAGAALWMVFSVALVIEFGAPHLKVRDGGFVIPASITSGKVAVHPDQLVAREKTLQLLCCFLTITSALGLGFFHRHALFMATRSTH